MKFAKKMMSETPSLKYHIHKVLPGFDNGRSHKVLHASDLTRDEYEFCPREYALMDTLNLKRKGNYIGTSLRTTFDMGNAVHDLVRQEWARDIAVGTWKCLACGSNKNFSAYPNICDTDKCHSSRFTYREEVFWSSEGHYVSSIDMLAKFPTLIKLVAVEIKTIDKDKFKTLVAPHAEHRLRSSLYLRSISNSTHICRDRINTEKALILYVSKGFGTKDTTLKENGISDAPFSPFKEFWVDRDDESTDHLVKRAMELDDFRRGTKAMPHPIHPSGLHKRCQSCSVVKPCWSGMYPAGNLKNS